MKLNDLYRQAKEREKLDICRFMRDMRRAGLKMQHYKGRFWWEGPAVVVSGVDEVLQNTKIKCQWDNMGLDMIVYPQQSL